MFELVLGTHNPKKLIELRELMPPDLVRLVSLAELDDAIEVEETGTTFFENATLKAVEQAKHLNRWVLAEDSGLSVDALQGAPGVYSARFSGEAATDQSNNDLLLQKLADVPTERRGAHYTCQVCLSDPQGKLRLETKGECHGVIGREPSGGNGFGYDPLFIVPEMHQTFGELGPTVKQAISHRARALRQFLPAFLAFIDQDQPVG